eukprot:TRINITY_DN4606_c0_g2_i1.p1 TRINITY_DN4606_c0_g2~~TRINITY_DN4606_c0_g2_i1.p1  ORF type:complete len:213 (-),score=25.25 TRINITY_DN4606_c0_g2_i1:430-1068(-)
MSNRLQSLTTLGSNTMINQVMQKVSRNFKSRHCVTQEIEDSSRNALPRFHTHSILHNLITIKDKLIKTEELPYNKAIRSTKSIRCKEIAEDNDSSADIANCEDIKESIPASIKISHLPSKLSHKRLLKFPNKYRKTKGSIEGNTFVHSMKKGFEGGRCDCKKDPKLPCCVKAKHWIETIFKAKSKHFLYTKCKKLYKVNAMNTIGNIGGRGE